jgi:hypothetical protein
MDHPEAIRTLAHSAIEHTTDHAKRQLSAGFARSSYSRNAKTLRRLF